MENRVVRQNSRDAMSTNKDRIKIDPAWVAKISAVMPDLWLQTYDPYGKRELTKKLSQLGGVVPPDVAAFYSITDGGEIEELECFIFSLDEALEIAPEINMLQTSMPVLPLFGGLREGSDPICMLLEPGLAGTMVQFMHDGDYRSRVHSLSFYEFLLAIAKFDEGPLVPSQHKFSFPKKLTKRELKVHDLLTKRSKLPVDPNSVCENAEEEPELMEILAKSMCESLA